MKIIAPDDERESNLCLRQQNRIIFPTESKYRDQADRDNQPNDCHLQTEAR